MISCPTCQRKISENANACPGCGEELGARHRQEALSYSLRLALMLAILAACGLLLLSPGIIINALRGRYRHTPENILWASLSDWQTWAIAVPISATALTILSLV